MKIILTIAGLLCFANSGLAQTTAATATRYDFNGNAIGTSGNGPALPGDLWATITHNYSTTAGVAPYQCGLLVSPGDGFAYHIDEANGSQIAAFPVADNNDSWLGYDVSRDLIITTNALLDVVRGYTPGNPAPVFSVPSPTPGPVGAAWDSLRDEYVYCDWSSDDIVVLDPTTQAVIRSFNYSGTLDRMAGVAYDPTDDVYVVGDRDTSRHYLVDPMTGALGTNYLTAGSGINDPQGAGLSSNGGVWAGAFGLNFLFEQEAGHGPVSGGCGADPGAAYCFGDATGASCPCSGFGGLGEGCANSSGAGAVLVGSGVPSVGNDTFQFDVSGVPGAKPGLILRGDNQVANPVGDGILCTGGSSQRSQVQVTAGGATTYTNFNGAGFGSVANVGAATNFQFWYRDGASTCSGFGFNFTNGWSVVYLP